MKRRHKILVVDDNPVNVEIIKEMLNDQYRLEIASTGEEALKVAVEFQPDVILLDIMMPGIDGYEVCRRLRANSSLQYTKIIMVSAKVSASERLEGYGAGTDDYMTKPFDEDELLSKIQVFLRLKSVEEVDRLKSDMLSVLSHEVRTPLNNIILPAEMLRSDRDVSETETRRLAQIAFHSAKRLEKFFSKVMALIAMKRGHWKFNFRRADLSAVARDAVCEAAEIASSRNVKIVEEYRSNPTVVMDVEEMKRVLLDILDNAIRFSLPEGEVTVEVFSDDEDAFLSVTDQGKGIDAEFLPRVFDEFADADTDHHTDGQGLSLALSRHIVLEHDGAIEAESTRGVGTTFTVRVPLKSESDAVQEKATRISCDAVPLKGETVFQAQIPGDMHLTEELSARLIMEARKAGLVGQEEQCKIAACFKEAIENAIVHGNRGDSDLSVFVRLFYDGGEWGLLVEDQGRGFFGKEQVLFNPDGYLQHKKKRGISLMEQIMDKVSFFNGGRSVVLEKRTVAALKSRDGRRSISRFR